MYILIAFAMGSLGLSVNKTPQSSSTFLTILAEFSNAVFCNSTICVLFRYPLIALLEVVESFQEILVL